MRETTEPCGRCGRGLKSAKSKKEGYGPVCLRKNAAEEAMAAAKATDRKE